MSLTLKAARVNAGLTQTEAAKRLNISQNTLIGWEKGRRYPTLLQARDMSNLYGVPIDEFFLP